MESPSQWYGAASIGGACMVIVLGLAALTTARAAYRCCCVQRFSFAGAHVLVTGGSSGIGLAVAQEAAARGAVVTVLARTRSKLVSAVDSLDSARAAAGSDHTTASPHGFECADVTDPAAVEAACAAAVAARGPISVLVACAGAAQPGYFLDQTSSVFERSMQLNYLGVVNAVKAVTPAMCERGEGRIVLVASGAAVVSFIGYSSYAPTKWALRGFGDALRNELVGFDRAAGGNGARAGGVRVHIAYPPDTQTPGFDLENESKPVETSRVAPPDVYPPRAVAVKMLRASRTVLMGADTGVSSSLTRPPHHASLPHSSLHPDRAFQAGSRWATTTSLRPIRCKTC